MASESSSSSSRRSPVRKPRKKKEAASTDVDVTLPAEDSQQGELDFGAGLDEETPAAPPARKPRKEREPAAEPRTRRESASTRSRREPAAESPRARRAPDPEPEPEPVIQQQHGLVDFDEVDFDDDDIGFGRNSIDDADSGSDPQGEAQASSQDRGPEGQYPNDRGGEQRPRRRRRRRGRRPDGQDGPPQQGGQYNQGGQGGSYNQGQGGGYNQGSGGYGRNSGGGYNQNSGGQNSGGGYQGGGYGQNRNQNRGRNQNQQSRGGAGGGNRNNNRNEQANRGRRVSKFEQNAAPTGPAVTSGVIEGVLELHPKGYGFLRSPENDYSARDTDPFISSSFVEKHQLREGIRLKGEIGPGTRGQGPRLLSIESIDNGPVEEYEKLKHFDTLTAINPFEQIKLETGPQPVTMRVMDLLTPIGKGQRALIVAPPRTGKTMLMQDIANSVSKNHPEIHLIVLLIDERPEEVTEMRRTVRGEVIASSMDQDVESHVRISQLIIERGKRIAESGKDCFILLDSVTRTARAFNKWVGGGRERGATGTGGLDVRAMDIPRKMFGTARRFDEGGSLTVCATALIDTGSRMDEAIFQEFKGTGNMEMVLSRDLAERRVWPSIDISKSGTRREEKIIDPDLLEGIIMLRRSLVSMSPVEAMEQLTKTLAKFPTNREFLQRIRSVL